MKYYISILMFMLMATSISAQEHEGGKREYKREGKKEKRGKKDSRMEAKKIGYITEELDLSSEEAQKFWPIYNDFQNKMKAFREESKENRRNEGEFTDAEAEVFLNNIFEQEQEILNLKKDYYKNLESALSKAKIAKLFTIERKFREKLYKSIKRKMNRKDKSKEK